MEDLIYAVLWTAVIPGLVLGLWAGIRSGFVWLVLGGLVGVIGGVAGGLGLPTFLDSLGRADLNGPLTVVAGSVLGALILLLLTSGLRKS